MQVLPFSDTAVWTQVRVGILFTQDCFQLLSSSHLPRDRALRPSAATVGCTRTIRFTRKLATANPLLLPAATLSGREHGDNSRKWRRVNHSWEFYLELWYCTAVLFQFHLVLFPDHTSKLIMKGSGQLEQNLPFLWSENWTQSTCTLLSHHIAATWEGKGTSLHLPVPLRQLVRFISVWNASRTVGDFAQHSGKTHSIDMTPEGCAGPLNAN